MFTLETTEAAGLFGIRPIRRKDLRGDFVKTFHADEFRRLNLRSDFTESYISTSKRDVLRGMHFQTPPHDHAKLVYCLAGEVIDVAVDMRRGSATYRRAFGFRLDGAVASGVYMPAGFAHGFLVLTEEATLSYAVTAVHAPEHDHGVLWSSIDFDWPTTTPILSDRDARFPGIDAYDSPFGTP